MTGMENRMEKKMDNKTQAEVLWQDLQDVV